MPSPMLAEEANLRSVEGQTSDVIFSYTEFPSSLGYLRRRQWRRSQWRREQERRKKKKNEI